MYLITQIERLISQLSTIRIQNSASLHKLLFIDSVVVVGSSCVGKSTLVDIVRSSELVMRGAVEIPLRYITRSMRLGDNLAENRHIESDQFAALVSDGTIDLHWTRPMDGGRVEQYGFGRTQTASLSLYSGNNALFSNAGSVAPTGYLDQALWIGVFAPDSIRERRLIERSPDLLAQRPKEVQFRLGDRSEGIYDYVHLVIDNHGDSEPRCKIEFLELIEYICTTKIDP